MDACRVQRAATAGPAGPARASVCIRHIYPDSGRAGSLTRPNARPVRRPRPTHTPRRAGRRAAGPFH